MEYDSFTKGIGCWTRRDSEESRRVLYVCTGV